MNDAGPERRLDSLACDDARGQEIVERIDVLGKYPEMTRKQEDEFDGLYREIKEIDRRARLDEVLGAATGRGAAFTEPESGETQRQRRPGEHGRAARVIDAAFRGGLLPDFAAERATALLDRGSVHERGLAAQWAAAAGNPDYTTAVAKILGNPQRGHLEWSAQETAAYKDAAEAQRAMSLSPTSAGGFMVPLTLDPAILLNNAGSINPLRQVARVEQIVTTTWSGVTSAGATAEWKTEAAQAADGSPTLANPQVPVWLGDVDVPYSYEVEQDAVNFLSELQKVLTDAASLLQNTAFTVGSGSQPGGIVPGATTSPVLTAGAFIAANVYSLQNALPPRFQAGASFLMNLAVINAIAQFETTAGALKFPEVKDGTLLRRPLYEVSDMSGDMTTATSVFGLYGDIRQAFIIVDRVGSTLEILPGFGANQRPTAQRHAFLTFRTGSKVIVPEAIRQLKKS